MNNRALVIVSLIYGLLLTALVTRNGGVLSLAIPFLVYFIVGALQAPTRIQLGARRALDQPSAAGEEPVECRVAVQNQGEPLLNLCVRDAQLGTMTITEGQAERWLSLAPGEAAELRYVLRASRGLYTWDAIHARAADPFGLFEMEQDVPAPGEILVRPGTVKSRQLALKPRLTLRTAGTIPARRAGSGYDFWGVREYRIGDPLRRLNWRLAARHPRRLFTNEYEREEIADFGIIVDARRFTNEEAGEQALFERSISAAASLSEAFLKQGNRLALLVFGETLQSVFPGYGTRQLHLVLRQLAQARLGTNFPLAYLGYFPGRLFPSRSIIVIFSALGPQDLEAYARLRALEHEVLLISPDPVEQAGRGLEQTMVNQLAVRAARVERLAQLKQLVRLGVKVINWQTEEPVETILQRVPRLLERGTNV